jgi:perosamine synthetase
MSNRRKPIPWAQPIFWGKELRYVTDAVQSTWISGGRYLEKLENDFQKILRLKYPLAVSSGTTAIHLAYLGLGLKPGDEVIVPGFSFMTAANIALHMGLRPVFSEVDPETWCLSAADVERRITAKTKAIVAVHTYGNVCDMSAIITLAREWHLAVIEDCAESLFSKYRGTYCGTFGTIATFSFQATKTITTGEGGLVATESNELYRRMALYRSHGMDRSKKWYWHELPGHNFRLTNFQAAMGVAQLEKRKSIVTGRQRVVERYRKHLAGEDGLTLQKIEKNVDPVIWAVALTLDPRFFPQGRDRVVAQLKAKGIETRPGFYASSLLDIYEKHRLPVAEQISCRVISLPTFPTLKDQDIAYICEQVIALR